MNINLEELLYNPNYQLIAKMSRRFECIQKVVEFPSHINAEEGAPLRKFIKEFRYLCDKQADKCDSFNTINNVRSRDYAARVKAEENEARVKLEEEEAAEAAEKARMGEAAKKVKETVAKLQAEASIAAMSPKTTPQQLTDQTNLLNALVGRVNRLSAASVEHKEIPDSIQTAFAKLQIPFFSGVKPERPLYEVYFEMAKLGTMSARYHAVIAGDACVALVYDTRFEDGFQYLPPNLGDEQISISVPKTKETYLCSSLGLHWSLGCLDVVILIRYKED
jgi:hypothetical protein